MLERNKNHEFNYRNYELQNIFLSMEHKRISEELFSHGVVSRILQNKKLSRGPVISPNDLLDKIFVPSLRKARYGDREELLLDLTAISFSDNTKTYTHYKLGMIDDTKTIFPYADIYHDDMELVFNAAENLIQHKENGLLPDLTFNLLTIIDPSSSMRNK
ncbi:MAG: hypothetical protein NVSMB46_02550 [Candidatus Saccharimonadales bacterium]